MLKLWFLPLCSILVASKDILILPCAGLTHRRSMLPYALSLAERGHNVTIWSPDLKDSALTKLPRNLQDLVFVVNSTDRFLLDLVKYENETVTAKLLWEMRGYSHIGIIFFWKTLSGVLETLLSDYAEEIYRISSQHWDLVIADALFTPWSIPIVRLSGAPYLLWSTTIHVGETVPFTSMAHYPSLAARDDVNLPKNFFHRVENLLNFMIDRLFVQKLLEYFIKPSLKNIWTDFSFIEMERNSLTQISQFPVLFDYPVPLSRVNLKISSLCPSQSQLPINFLNFISEPNSKGIILVAFGHQVKWSAASETQFGSFKSGLSQIVGYQIIWQCDIPVANFSSPLPKNILVTKWLPQVDLLLHPNMKLFITHGGLKSLQESICAGVPMVVMPQAAEQCRNAAIIRKFNLGVLLDKLNLDPSVVGNSIKQVLTDSIYKANVERFRDMTFSTPIPNKNASIHLLETFSKRNTGSHSIKESKFVYCNCDVCFVIFIIYGFKVFIVMTIFMN